MLALRRRSALAVADGWLSAGVRLFQLRAKSLAGGALLDLADGLCTRARAAGAVFVVNDRADIARMAGAHGLHVGQSDLPPVDARRIVGDSAIVGLSAHSGRQAKTAVRSPIDYLAMGPVFDTSTKARPDPVVGLDGIRGVAAAVGLGGRPVVGIGGITLARAPAVIDAGASLVAVIADLLADDPERRAREFLVALQ